MTNHCQSCGRQVQPAHNYCGNCGTPIHATKETVDRKGVFELPENATDLIGMFLDADIRWARQQVHAEIESRNMTPAAEAVSKTVVALQAVQKQAQRDQHQQRRMRQ